MKLSGKAAAGVAALLAILVLGLCAYLLTTPASCQAAGSIEGHVTGRETLLYGGYCVEFWIDRYQGLLAGLLALAAAAAALLSIHRQMRQAEDLASKANKAAREQANQRGNDAWLVFCAHLGHFNGIIVFSLIGKHPSIYDRLSVNDKLTIIERIKKELNASNHYGLRGLILDIELLMNDLRVFDRISAKRFIADLKYIHSIMEIIAVCGIDEMEMATLQINALRLAIRNTQATAERLGKITY
ncbi:hypothetical protein [Labrys monachus]|uniref:GGDEF domain-containing protein n=1 Tax=Labrys monachus TaxID=217067 RepID=A0ABU0F7R8_9HYPH|nr:hypothetical protein [Labrys monachus]MDQ0390655.1 hypothetical protein [Labrys monachus]